VVAEYVNAAHDAGLTEVRLIHGRGKGVQRAIVQAALEKHPLVLSFDDARDAAVALRPLAGHFAATLFGVGLLGAALLAAAIVPLSTAYSVSEAVGQEAALDDPIRAAPFFYGAYVAILVVGAAIVLVPGAPLVPILYFTQVLNAVLLLPLLVALRALARREDVCDEFRNGRLADTVVLAALALVAASVIGLGAAVFL